VQDREEIRVNPYYYFFKIRDPLSRELIPWIVALIRVMPCDLITSERSHYSTLLQWQLNFSMGFGGDILITALGKNEKWRMTTVHWDCLIGSCILAV
jgi:hypothetical protein